MQRCNKQINVNVYKKSQYSSIIISKKDVFQRTTFIYFNRYLFHDSTFIYFTGLLVPHATFISQLCISICQMQIRGLGYFTDSDQNNSTSYLARQLDLDDQDSRQSVVQTIWMTSMGSKIPCYP